MRESTSFGEPQRLVLASGSPRRREILAALGVSVELASVEVDETPKTGEAPDALALRLARAKALAGATACPGRAVLGADTVVALDGRPLGKPANRAEATRMLQALRGRSHTVYTAVALARLERTESGDGASSVTIWDAIDHSLVQMRDYSDAEIDAYIATGDPFDKAGSYAIQHVDFHPVVWHHGCYLTIVGLSLPALQQVLEAAGAPLSEGAAFLPSVCRLCHDQGPRLTGAFCFGAQHENAATAPAPGLYSDRHQ